jgi:hypothetical protein
MSPQALGSSNDELLDMGLPGSNPSSSAKTRSKTRLRKTMGSLDFRIAADAVEYLRNVLLRTGDGELLVLTVAPTVAHESSPNFDGNVSDISEQALAALARRYLESLPRPVPLRWTVGGMRKSRLSGEKIVVIDGIECFFPDEVLAVIRGRILRLRRNELIFDPELDPPPSLPALPNGS